MHFDLAILGAGAAGMMAAVAAGERLRGTGKSVAIFEKNPQPGIKVLVCGGGRCNFTNAGTTDFLIDQFGRNGRFLTPALRHLDNDGLRAFFNDLGVPSHVEPGGKVYPDSNQARSVVNALVHRMRELGVQIFTGPAGTITSLTQAPAATPDRAEITGTPGESTIFPTPSSTSEPSDPSAVHFQFSTQNGQTCTAHAVLLAVGGMSYQRMGTVGDGYRFAQHLGHTVITPRPAIVGLLTKEEWPKTLPGLAVRDVEVRIAISGTLPRLATGKPAPSVNDLLFTHFGLSGPAVLNVSEIVAELLEKFDAVPLKVDFARHLTHEQCHAQLRAWQQHQGRKLLRKLLAQSGPDVIITSTSPDKSWADLPADEAVKNQASTIKNTLTLPTRLAEKFLEIEQIPADQLAATLTSAQMHRLVERVKNSTFAIHATRGFKEAMVTAGGIKLSEVNPNTLESKILPNLFLTGEVLDLTGPSGGYNLQLAFSTGHLAGITIAQRLAGTSILTANQTGSPAVSPPRPAGASAPPPPPAPARHAPSS
jgi:predicted flavoprotein YhiN